MKMFRLFSVLAVCAAMMLAGCSNGDDAPATYTITVTAGGNGSAVADITTAEEGATITLTATADPGCEFSGWTVESGGITLPAAATATFTMPAANVSVKAEFIVRGVLINGTIWAICNVDAPDTFAANPEDDGMLYQWNRKIGWSSTNPMVNSENGTIWDSTSPEGDEWAAGNDPCPEGWRVPTDNEQIALCDPEKTTNELATLNEVEGYKFTDIDSGNSVFFPLARYRNPNLAGQLGSTGNSRYWSATKRADSPTICLSLAIYSVSGITKSSGLGRTYAASVRCVAK